MPKIEVVKFDGRRKKSVATTQINTVEVEVVRVKITLACTECKQRNYNMTKEKKNHPERLETKSIVNSVEHTQCTKRRNKIVV